MKSSAIFHSSTIYLNIFILYNCYIIHGYNLTESTARVWSHPTDDKPTPPVHLLIFNRLSAPITYLDSAFKGKGDFSRMGPRRIEASSWGEVIVTANPLYEDIYGYIRFIATDTGREIPITLFFSIPSEHLKRLSWYGIELYSDDPHTLMCRAGNATNVSQINDGFRTFAYQNNDETISQVNSRGLTLAARMYKHPMDRVIVKLRVWNSKMTAPMPSAEAVFTADGTHNIQSSSSMSTTFRTPRTTKILTTTATLVFAATPDMTKPATAITTKTSTATKTMPTNKTTTTPTMTPTVTTMWTMPSFTTLTTSTWTTPTAATTRSTSSTTQITAMTTRTALSSTTSTIATINATPTATSTTPMAKPITTTSRTSTIHLTNSTNITAPSTTPNTTTTSTSPIVPSTTPTTTTITSTASTSTSLLTTAIVEDYEYYGETVPW